MNNFLSIRYPPPKNSRAAPILVTEESIEALLFCLVHSIEFLSSQGTQRNRTVSAPAGGAGTNNNSAASPVNSSAVLGRDPAGNLISNQGFGPQQSTPSMMQLHQQHQQHPNASMRPEDIRRLYVEPVVQFTKLLGGVHYVACKRHNDTLTQSLHRSVLEAKRILYPLAREDGSVNASQSLSIASDSGGTDADSSRTHNSVPFDLRVRVSYEEKKRVFFVERKRQVPILEWLFTIVKTPNQWTVANDRSSPSSPAVPSPTSTTAQANDLSALEKKTLQYYPNNPAQIREVLHFILMKMYDCIDTNLYSDFQSGELIYNVSVETAHQQLYR